MNKMPPTNEFPFRTVRNGIPSTAPTYTLKKSYLFFLRQTPNWFGVCPIDYMYLKIQKIFREKKENLNMATSGFIFKKQ